MCYVVVFITANFVLKECCGLMDHVSVVGPLGLSQDVACCSFVSYSSPDGPLQGVQVSLRDILSSLHGRSPPPCLQQSARGQLGPTCWKSQQQQDIAASMHSLSEPK